MTKSNEFNFPNWIKSICNRIDDRLDVVLRENRTDSRILRAARYSVLGGGKRLRPALVYAGCDATDGSYDSADNSACAVELVHAYSLIHDDLPAMDNDEMRRGQPTTHIAYGESIAILAGDALQALAFQILARKNNLGKQIRLKQIEILSEAINFNGMAYGQELDLLAENNKLELHQLELMHKCKTGSLIKASVLMGAIVGKRKSKKNICILERYAENIGLAFQIHDDILDITGSIEQLGKNVNRDSDLGKSTFPALVGLDESKKRAKKLVEEAIDILLPIPGNPTPLIELAKLIITRIN